MTIAVFLKADGKHRRSAARRIAQSIGYSFHHLHELVTFATELLDGGLISVTFANELLDGGLISVTFATELLDGGLISVDGGLISVTFATELLELVLDGTDLCVGAAIFGPNGIDWNCRQACDRLG